MFDNAEYIYDNLKFTSRLYLNLQKKNVSTETVLVKIHHDILKAFEEQKGVLLTGLDLSAAIDTLDHDILIMVLANMHGIGGLAREWFKDYLRNRTVQVLVGNSGIRGCKYPILCTTGIMCRPSTT